MTQAELKKRIDDYLTEKVRSSEIQATRIDVINPKKTQVISQGRIQDFFEGGGFSKNSEICQTFS